MTTRTLNLDDNLYRYLLDVSLRETPLMTRLREETAKLPNARWQIAPEQGQFIALLLTLIGARRALEVGTFTGYSALCMATALGEQGRLTCCDLPGDYHLTARRYWREAAVEERIELRLGPALETCVRCSTKAWPGNSTWPSSTPTRPTTPNTWKPRWRWCARVGWCFSTTCCGAAGCSKRSRRVRIPAASSSSTWR
ncbi:putative O-methyltransferase [Pseudomonas aeruginosa PA38182]|nr:putative O-methyltransferase [Pseudomonas aeruginosa PA38182]